MRDMTCPICKRHVPRSEYLSQIFGEDEWAEWFANLVTHYRHEHISYYDKSWQNWAYGRKNPEYTDHDEFKAKVNNRAKRQLIRAILRHKTMMKSEKSKLIESCTRLQYNDSATTDLIDKALKKMEKLPQSRTLSQF